MLSSTSRHLLLRNGRTVAAMAPTRNYSGYGDTDQIAYGVNHESQSRATINIEHQGRESVKEGRGSGTGGYGETGGRPDGEKHAAASGDKKGGKRPQPKILDESQQRGSESEGTKKHNQEMDQRYDHRKDGKDDKVDKGYWKGELKWSIGPCQLRLKLTMGRSGRRP